MKFRVVYYLVNTGRPVCLFCLLANKRVHNQKSGHILNWIPKTTWSEPEPNC